MQFGRAKEKLLVNAFEWVYALRRSEDKVLQVCLSGGDQRQRVGRQNRKCEEIKGKAPEGHRLFLSAWLNNRANEVVAQIAVGIAHIARADDAGASGVFAMLPGK